MTIELLSIPTKKYTRSIKWLRLSRHLLSVILCSTFLSILIEVNTSWIGLLSDQVWAQPQPNTVGSIEGELISNGRWLRDQADEPRKSQSLPTLWNTRLALDIPLNQYLWLGGESTITWLSEPSMRVWSNGQLTAKYSGGRRIAFSPALRGRLDFPLDCRWVIEGLSAVGLTHWGKNEGSAMEAQDDARWGLTWRISLGLRYAINTQVQAVLSISYAEQIAYGDRDDLSYNGYPIAFGLRGGF